MRQMIICTCPCPSNAFFVQYSTISIQQLFELLFGLAAFLAETLLFYALP